VQQHKKVRTRSLIILFQPFPTVEQLMFPNNEEDITYLDVEEDSDEPSGLKFEDQDWEQYLP
jgi:hypothetical protein